LIIVLWSLCLLASFAVMLGYNVRQKADLVRRLNERDTLRSVAGAGVKMAAFQVKKNKEAEDTWFALSSELCGNGGFLSDTNMGDAQYSVWYEYRNDQTGAQERRYGLIDEESKVNINTEGRPAMQRLFQVVLGLDERDAQELAACIIDWRDEDSELTTPDSAEDSHYRNQEFSYGAKNGPFEVLEELLLVKGMTQDLFEVLKNYITIYGSGKVNINTASAPVLFALGFSADDVERITSFRCGADGVAGTADDNIFVTPGDIGRQLSQAYAASDADAARITAIAGEKLCANSYYFMARSHARMNNRVNTVETVAVIDNKGTILYWREF